MVDNSENNTDKDFPKDTTWELHIDQIDDVALLFSFLSEKSKEKEISDFLINQYHVEHIYLDLMKSRDSE